MKTYEYAKLCLSRNKEIGKVIHRFETQETSEELVEEMTGLLGVLDGLGQSGWHAFNKTHKTVWFARVVPETPVDANSEDPFGGEIIPLENTRPKITPLPEEDHSAEIEEKFYFSQFALADGYKFIRLIHVTMQESSRISAGLQLQNKKKYKQYLSGPLEDKAEIREEILLKSTTPERVIANFMKLEEDPHYCNMEVSK